MTLRKTILFIVLVSLSAAFCGCFHSREEALQLDSASYFVFKGKTEGAAVTVLKDGKPIWTDMAVEPDARYTIKPNTYEVVVTREGRTMVRRTVFLSDGMTFEILIP